MMTDLNQGLANYGLRAKPDCPLFSYVPRTKTVFNIFLNGWKKSKEKYFVTHENYLKFKFVSMNKVLLEHSRTHLLIYCLGHFHATKAEFSSCDKPYGPQRLKYLLSSP